jgi:Transposase DDE domain
MAAKGRQPIKEDELVCLKLVQTILPICAALDRTHPEVHGNTKLHLTDCLVVLLCAFFNPTVRSLRLIEQLSEMSWVQEQMEPDRVCRSTLSDALERFDPEQLVPVINQLMQQIPHLGKRDGDLAKICKRLIAGDGSTFNLAADVVWAMMRRRGGKKGAHGTCRLNLQLDVDRFIPADLSVSGSDEGSEAAAFMKRIISGVVYLLDRNFVHFGMINAVLDNGSDLVLRLKADTKFNFTEELTLSAKDVEAGVISDRMGVLPGSVGSRTGPPPKQILREVIVKGSDGKILRLLTNLLDLPAHVIAELYRLRWQIELFLRWLKVCVGFEHLISHGQRGITFQFYTAVIGCLLMHVRTGRKVNKYGVFLFGQVAAGLATLEKILPMLERIEREKELERQRRARKKAQKMLDGLSLKNPALLPG